jgi:hypothetical protein
LADFVGQHRFQFGRGELLQEGVEKDDLAEPSETGEEGI